MKKYLFTFIVISFLLTGCSSKTEVQETTINNPYEISIDNEILSYYGNKDSIPKSFDVLKFMIYCYFGLRFFHLRLEEILVIFTD